MRYQAVCECAREQEKGLVCLHWYGRLLRFTAWRLVIWSSPQTLSFFFAFPLMLLCCCLIYLPKMWTIDILYGKQVSAVCSFKNFSKKSLWSWFLAILSAKGLTEIKHCASPYHMFPKLGIHSHNPSIFILSSGQILKLITFPSASVLLHHMKVINISAKWLELSLLAC